MQEGLLFEFELAYSECRISGNNSSGLGRTLMKPCSLEIMIAVSSIL